VSEHSGAVPDTTETARQVAAAALAVPGVWEMHPGQFGEVATYAPGERISGVRVGVRSGEVHIVTDLTRNLVIVGEEVRAAAERLAGVPFVVTVEDIATATDPDSTPDARSLETEER
jgi:hypothetical protein